MGKLDTVLMHASVQHEPCFSHSMFIKVATAAYVSQHGETKIVVFFCCSSRFEALLLHALAFLDSYKKVTTVLRS